MKYQMSFRRKSDILTRESSHKKLTLLLWLHVPFDATPL